MKRYFILVVTMFLSGVMNAYCLADQPVGSRGQSYELSGKIEKGVRIIEVKASRYKFEPDPIVVNLGEKVRLAVTSTDVTHGIAISEFKVSLSIPVGKTKEVEFIADREGKFSAYCSVYCGPGHNRMQADFIVIKEEVSPK